MGLTSGRIKLIISTILFIIIISTNVLASDTFTDTDGNVIKSVIMDGSISSDIGVSKANLNYAYNYYYKVPVAIRKQFISDKWDIKVVNYELQDRYSISYDIIGLTVVSENTIYIENEQKSIRKALVHEIGHYIDYKNGYISSKKDFQYIYKLESGRLLDSKDNYKVASYNSKEYFAEVFRAYILNKTSLKARAPLSYSYMNNLINKQGRKTDESN